jgi:hypothetical protein
MIYDFLGRTELWEDYMSLDWIKVMHNKQHVEEEEVKKLLNQFNEKMSVLSDKSLMKIEH